MKTLKITSEVQYNKALERIEVLLKEVGNDTSVHDQKFIELDQLSDIVVDYEEKHYPVPLQLCKK